MKDLRKLYIECVAEMRTINMDISNRILEVKVNGRLRKAMGRCTHNWMNNTYMIEINPCMLADEVEVKQTKGTIIHELLHTCPNCMNHDFEWLRRAHKVNKAFGYNVKQYAEANELKEANVKLKEDEYKYAIKCEKCGAQWKYKRWGKILSNPSMYKCGCGGALKPICLDGSRDILAAHNVR